MVPASMMRCPSGPGTAARVACLQRLATALSGYHDLDVAVRADGPAPCLAVRNTAARLMSETVTVSASGDRLAYMWSSTHGGYGASPVSGPVIHHRTHHAPTAEALRTLIRQDIERHAAERERNTRLRAAMSAVGASPDG